MFKDSINGLDNIITDDIYHGANIVIMGSAGSFKSNLAYTLLLKNTLEANEFGVYFTFEERKENIARNITSLGLNLLGQEKIRIIDYNDIKEKSFDLGSISDNLNIIKIFIRNLKREYGDKFRWFILDSINALYNSLDQKTLRPRIFNLFETLRANNLVSFIILETLDDSIDRSKFYCEKFLADAVFKLGTLESNNEVLRYIQVKKFRAVKHDMKKYQFIINDNGVTILDPILM